MIDCFLYWRENMPFAGFQRPLLAKVGYFCPIIGYFKNGLIIVFRHYFFDGSLMVGLNSTFKIHKNQVWIRLNYWMRILYIQRTETINGIKMDGLFKYSFEQSRNLLWRPKQCSVSFFYCQPSTLSRLNRPVQRSWTVHFDSWFWALNVYFIQSS